MQIIRHRSGCTPSWRAISMVVGLLAPTGCGDDGMSPGAMPSTGNASASESLDSTGSSSSIATGTTLGLSTGEGLDSTGPATSTTLGTDSASSTTMGSSSGEPNPPPLPQDDVYFVRADSVPLLVNAADGLLANDVEPDGQMLVAQSGEFMSMAGGTVIVQDDGAFEYSPPVDFFGDDRLTYWAVDEGGAMGAAVARFTVASADIGVDELFAGHGGFAIDGALFGDQSGFVVDGGGDVNGDGLDDLLVTSIESGGSNLGRAWIVWGKAEGGVVELNGVSAGGGGFEIIGEAPSGFAGHAAAIVGDTNADGLADILVGAPQAGASGRAYLVHGKADTQAVDLADLAMGLGGFMLEGVGVGEDAGFAVSAAGDMNGDGLADFAIGAPEGGPVPGGGRTYVVFGKLDTDPVALDTIYAGTGGFAVHGENFDDNSGDSLASAGDVNADGLDDLLIGARLANAGGIGNSGRCYVVFGRVQTTLIDLDTLGVGGFVIDGETSFDEACSAVAGLGDINGDGRADLAVGAPGAQNDLALQGRVYIVRGKVDSNPVLLTEVASGIGGFAIDGEAMGSFLGSAVGGGSDIDGDGFGDIVIGTANVNTPGPFSGRGYVVYGKGSGATAPLVDLGVRLDGFSVSADAAQMRLGWAVAAAGDVNGDGFGDVIVSATRRASAAGPQAGRSYVLFGSNYRGALSHRGGSGDDQIFASTAPDVVVAGAGADQIHSGGGSDVIYGGAGDDFIGIRNGQFFRLDGGSGIDTLAIEDGDVQLNLALVTDFALRNFEVIDMSGTGDNTLSLAYRDLRAIVGPTRTLRVVGDRLDRVVADLSGGGFIDQGVSAGVHTWTNGVVTLQTVEPLIAVVSL